MKERARDDSLSFLKQAFDLLPSPPSPTINRTYTRKLFLDVWIDISFWSKLAINKKTEFLCHNVVIDYLCFHCVLVDQSDPYGFIAGQHFNSVLRRYGAPIIILNLVKVSDQLE